MQPMGADALRALPDPALTPSDCTCAHLRCAGWESVMAPIGEPLLQRLGTLRASDDDGPTLDEWPGSRYWADDAPIAPKHFPYNRCEIWACDACGRGFVQYTEFGGYYVDHRIRAVNPTLVV
jgi:hypothetical protein